MDSRKILNLDAKAIVKRKRKCRYRYLAKENGLEWVQV